jgi:hypothetical protein
MKRLLKVSFDLALLSLIPVLSWFALGLLVDKNLINVFTLTYPIQFIWYIHKSIFSTGANISKEKDKNKNATMSGIVIGSIVGFIVFGLIALNIDNYITFMNMDINIYHNFAIYSVIQLYIQLVFNFYIEKLYFEDKNTLANKYSFGFNLINFFVLILTSLIFNNHFLIIIITLISILIYVLVVAIRESNRFRLELKMLNYIKYDSVELFNNVAFFFIFLFGLSNVLEFGVEYATALTFVALITDTQWDVFTAITVVAKIDISRNNFNYKEHRNNAYKLLGILIGSIIIMAMLLFNNYNLNIGITLTFLGFEIANFFMTPVYKIKTCFLQLEYSALKTTINKMIASTSRFAFSFLKSPYCTGIGQVFSSVYQFISINLIFNNNYKINTDGSVLKRQRSNK